VQDATALGAVREGEDGAEVPAEEFGCGSCLDSFSIGKADWVNSTRSIRLWTCGLSVQSRTLRGCGPATVTGNPLRPSRRRFGRANCV